MSIRPRLKIIREPQHEVTIINQHPDRSQNIPLILRMLISKFSHDIRNLCSVFTTRLTREQDHPGFLHQPRNADTEETQLAFLIASYHILVESLTSLDTLARDLYPLPTKTTKQSAPIKPFVSQMHTLHPWRFETIIIDIDDTCQINTEWVTLGHMLFTVLDVLHHLNPKSTTPIHIRLTEDISPYGLPPKRVLHIQDPGFAITESAYRQSIIRPFERIQSIDRMVGIVFNQTSGLSFGYDETTPDTITIMINEENDNE
jgi:hypothetical protein